MKTDLAEYVKWCADFSSTSLRAAVRELHDEADKAWRAARFDDGREFHRGKRAAFAMVLDRLVSSEAPAVDLVISDAIAPGEAYLVPRGMRVAFKDGAVTLVDNDGQPIDPATLAKITLE